MNASSVDTFIPTLFELSYLNTISLYLLPLILSITLFSFIYKRKSSDFVMSFPVTKAQIFMTNTLGGIIVITLMNLVNYLFTLILVTILNNVIIDYRMLFDNFLIWTIGHIFVFTCCNVAVSVSSNKITTVIVTLLILFFVPFTHTFMTSSAFRSDKNGAETYCDNAACAPKNYECYDSTCEEEKQNHIYRYATYHVEDSASYTLPYNLIVAGILNDHAQMDIPRSLVKMSILSLIYIPLGAYLFKRRKFEVVETSFKSDHIHIFVRSLTTVPILCMYYVLIKTGAVDIFTFIFLFAIIMTYIIIYDLITKKKVLNIFRSLAVLIMTSLIIFFVGEFTTTEKIVNVADIKKMEFNEPSYAGYTTNKDIINYIMSIHLDNSTGSYTHALPLSIEVNSKRYNFSIYTNDEQYNYIIDSLSKDNNYHFAKKVSANNIIAISISYTDEYIPKDSSLYQKIVTYISQSSPTISSYRNMTEFNEVDIYVYDNYNSSKLTFNIADKSLQSEILNYINRSAQTRLADKYDNITFFYVASSTDDYYVSSSSIAPLKEFLSKYRSEVVDPNREYLYISVNSVDTSNSYNNYNIIRSIFVTNHVEELKELLAKAKIDGDTSSEKGETDEELNG